MSIQVLKQTVEAKTRKLSARWTFEAAQDANSMHGLDIEAEIMAALAMEITAEIDQEILGSLSALATTGGTYDMNATFTGQPTFIGDRHAVLATLINQQANLIAQRTRRRGELGCAFTISINSSTSQLQHQHSHEQLKVFLKHQQTQNS